MSIIGGHIWCYCLVMTSGDFMKWNLFGTFWFALNNWQRAKWPFCIQIAGLLILLGCWGAYALPASAEVQTAGKISCIPDKGTPIVKVLLPAAEVSDKTPSKAEFVASARTDKFFRDGAVLGIHLSAIKPNSLLEKIGLINGDIVQCVEGKEADETWVLMRLLHALRAKSPAFITTERKSFIVVLE